MSEQLIQRWQQGDETAAEALYEAHSGRVFRLAYALLGNRDDAEEVMQDTMIYALTRINRYDPQRAAFATWLHTIAVSRCRDRGRRKRLPSISLGNWKDGGGDVAAPNSGPEEVTIGQENLHEIWQALEQLSPKLREAVVLRYWGNHTYQEMAQIMQCPLPTAQSRVRLAYERLRELLTPAGVLALKGEGLR
jgi:RNA polymerase sigma-70 factor (ECF subfamily)